MNRLVRGSVLIAAAVGVWACGGDPFAEDLETVTEISADPQVVSVSNTDSQAVVVEALNSLGQQNAAEFDHSDVTAGLVVTRDTGFLPVIEGEGLKTQARYFVKGTDSVTFVTGSFVVSVGDVSTTIEVNVTPNVVPLGFSTNTSQPGDTVTITAPGNLLFTDSTIVTFAGAIVTDSATVAPAPFGAAFVVSVAADGSTIDVVPGPNASGPVTFENVVVSYLPGQVFEFTSSNTFDTPIFTALGATYSTLTPALTDTVIVTAPAGLRFLPTSEIDFATDEGSILVGISADSQQLSIKVKPNTDTTVTVTGVIAAGAPQFPFALTDTVALTSVVIDSITPAFSNSSPPAGASVTMTAAGFKFGDRTDVGVTFAVGDAFIQSVSVDSNTVTMVPPPGGTGQPLVSGALADVFVLDLPSTTSMTVGASTFTGTDDPSTAPVLALPAPGNTLTIYDGGAFTGGTFAANDSRYYVINVAAPVVLDLSLAWGGGSDLGFYVLDNPITAVINSDADSFGGSGGADGNGQPEVATGVALAPGSYVLAVVKFGSAPGAYEMKITTQ